MTRRLTSIGWLILMALAAACSGAPVAPAQPTTAGTATPERVTLPPAWTVTPSETSVPATLTPSPTLHPSVLEAHQTAALWPTEHFVAVGAGADSTGWTRQELQDATLMLPPAFAVIDPRRYDDATEGFLQRVAARLLGTSQATAAPGAPLPTPPSLAQLGSAFGFEFLVAEDAQSRSDVSLVGWTLPQGLDLATVLNQAFGGLTGEVEVGSWEIVGGAPLPTARLFVRLFDRPRNTVADRVLYAIVEGDRLWVLSYGAGDFEAMLPVFETSALSLAPAS